MIKNSGYRLFANRLNLFAATVLVVILSAYVVPLFASQQVRRIAGVTIEVDQENYSGPCPMAVRLKGKIKADGPVGQVRYQLFQGDGTPWNHVRVLTINRQGEFTVQEFLQLGGGGNGGNLTVYLKVFMYVPLESNRITIKVECQRRAPNSPAPASQPRPGNPAYLRRSSFRPDSRANINSYRLPDGDVIMMTVEEDPGIGQDQIEIVLNTDPNVTWWKSILFTQGITPDDSWAGVKTVNSISTQDDDHGPKAMRLNFAELTHRYSSLVFAKGKVLGVHTEMYHLGGDGGGQFSGLNGKRVVFTWQKD